MQAHDWLQNKRHALDRRVLLWAHVLLGVATCSLYIYRVNLPLAASLAPNAGYFELWIALPIIVPYLASARFSWSAYSDPYVIHNRVRLAAFIFVLAMGAVFMGWFIASPPQGAERIDFVLASLMQGFAYMWAAQILLNVV